MAAREPENFSIEAGPMGPIGEGQALILRINRNCPWNKCMFCRVYKEKQFSTRNSREIRGDIDAVKKIRDLIETSSRQIDRSGGVTREVLRAVIKNHPEIYGRYPVDITQKHWRAFRSLNNAANWLAYGAKRVFLQDANALAMKPEILTSVLRYLKEVFPTVDTITCYARSKTFERRSVQELEELREAGLSWCFVGIESGCSDVLETMKKGVTKEEHVRGGQKAMAAGLHIAAFVMPGLSGGSRDTAGKHVSDTVAVLNEIRPTEVRVRSLAVLEGSPLYDRWKSGEFETADDDQMIEEIRMLIEGLTFDCTFETLQMTNPLFTIKGKFFQKKAEMLEKIDSYKALSALEKASFLLGRYVDEGYVDIVKGWGKYDSNLHGLIEDAETSIQAERDDAIKKTARAIFAIKSKGVP